MKNVITALCLFMCAISLNAQITAAINRLPDRAAEIRMRNESTASLVAFAVSARYSAARMSENRGSIIIYVDPAVDMFRKVNVCVKQNVPGHCRRTRSSACSAECMIAESRNGSQPIFEEPATAGIFADGSTVGDTALLAGLMLRRSNMLLAVELTLETLVDAGGRNVPRKPMISQFRKMADSVNRGYLPSEQRIGYDLYRSIIGKLVNVPAGPLGSAFPPAAFVEKEAAVLNQHRVTLSQLQPGVAGIGSIRR